ncbi:MAG TPA: sensor histidine kinase [Treponemataceae bacterium]|nr:sensor histidine kinase [Treponemataceae bacterium]
MFTTFRRSRFLPMTSLSQMLKYSYTIIIVLMLILPVTTILSSLAQSAQYDLMISNVSKTNRINQIVKTDISNELWDIVAGNRRFEEGRHYQIINSINQGLQEILETTSVTGNRQMLEVAGRAMNTLSNYVGRIGLQIQYRYPVIENEKLLDEIRGVAALVSDILEEFIVLEIESAERTNERIKTMVWVLAVFQMVTVLGVAGFAIFALQSVSVMINMPIKELELFSTKIASGDLEARADIPRIQELENLAVNLNTMAVKIRELIDMNILEQQNLQKSEMKALQAQITPHFLYNTLDTIIWLAEGKQYDQVIDITRAFSSFFRISLSRGRDWVTVADEIAHVENYLTIQKIRYRDILDYSIEYDPAMASYPVLKLVLQPLVENALYHGIKNKRGRGVLRVRAFREAGQLRFSVEDNGIGMTEERLAEVRRGLMADREGEGVADMYGLYNVSKRLQLYYGKDVFLKIKSVHREGTVVSFGVPQEAQNV